jgi:regulation of enolase protein 1 (concanavalin A-like superfamily)
MYRTTRRQFTSRILAATGGALLGGTILEASASAQAATLSGGEMLTRMKWLNEPASAAIAADKLVVRARPKTDFWRRTLTGNVVDSGHFFHLRVSGDFILEGRIDGKYAAVSDQAGLMVRVDAENWAKCGTEFFDGARHAAVVFTREFSDGSTMNDLVASGPVWWRAVRKGDSLETLCSLDGKNFTSVRLGYLVPATTADAGIMCAAPEGPGFECVFDNLKLTPGK